MFNKVKKVPFLFLVLFICSQFSLKADTPTNVIGKISDMASKITAEQKAIGSIIASVGVLLLGYEFACKRPERRYKTILQELDILHADIVKAKADLATLSNKKFLAELKKFTLEIQADIKLPSLTHLKSISSIIDRINDELITAKDITEISNFSILFKYIEEIKKIFPYSNLFKKIINKELLLKHCGKASFYHSQMRCYAFQIDVTKEILDELARRGLVDPLPENFLFIQNPAQLFAKDAQENDVILNKATSRHENMLEGRSENEHQRLKERFSAHPFIFGGNLSKSSCPWNYFLNNYNINGGGMLDFKKDICDVFQISDNCLESLNNLKNEYEGLFERGRILQIGIPTKWNNVRYDNAEYMNPIDSYAYLACPGAEAVYYEKPDGNKIYYVSDFLKYIEEDSYNAQHDFFIDRQEVAIILTEVSILNPYSKAEVYAHDAEPLDAIKFQEHLAKRAEFVKNIVDEIAATWKQDPTITYPRHFIGSPVFYENLHTNCI